MQATISRATGRPLITAFAVLAGATLACGSSSSPELTSFTGERGYTVSYPKDWTVQENVMSIASISTDIFSSPEEFDGFRPSVNILCEPLRTNVSLENYVAASKQSLSRIDITTESDKKISTGAGDGVLLTYKTEADDRTFEFAQVFVVDGDCGWVMTLTTPEGKRGDYMKLLERMARSFKAAPE